MEGQTEMVLNELCDIVTPRLKKLAPQGYRKMTQPNDGVGTCRLGRNQEIDGKSNTVPFSTVTVVRDFCSHPHK